MHEKNLEEILAQEEFLNKIGIIQEKHPSKSVIVPMEEVIKKASYGLRKFLDEKDTLAEGLAAILSPLKPEEALKVLDTTIEMVSSLSVEHYTALVGGDDEVYEELMNKF